MKKNLAISIPVFLAFVVMGFVDFVGVSVAYAGKELNLDKVTEQLIPFFTFIWFAILALPAGNWQSTYSKRLVLLSGVILTLIGCLLNFSVYTYVSVLIGFIFIGAGNTLIQVSCGPMLTEVYNPDKFSSGMSFGFFLKSLTALLGPVLAYFLAKTFGNWRYTFLIYVVFAAFTAILLYTNKVKENKPQHLPSFKTYLTLLKNPFFFIMFLGIVSIVGIDVGLITSLSGYFEDIYSLSAEDSSLVLSIYFISMMAGRFLGSILLRHFNTIQFLLYSSVLTLGFFLLFIFTKNLYLAYALIGLFGLTAANFFALVYAIAINKMPEHTNQISGLMIMGISGAAFAPLAMGTLNKLYGAQLSFGVVLAFIAFIIFSAVYAKFQRE